MDRFSETWRAGARIRHALLAMLLALTAGVGLAACGSSDDDGGSTGADTSAAGTSQAATSTVADPPPAESASGYVWSGTPEERAEAERAGEADAGAPVDAPTGKSIGVIQLSGQSATSRAITEAAKEIGEIFGFKVNVCDPNFDAQKIPQCATSIVSQNPSVVFSVSQNPGPLGSGLKEAADRGIPWFGTSSASTSSPYMNDLGADGFALARTLDEWLFRAIDERGAADPKRIFAITAPTVGVASLNEENQLKEDIAGASGFELIKHDLDLANAVQDTLNSSRQALEQNPDLAGMWTLCDFCLPLMAQTVASKQPDERRTVVAGMFSTPESIADIRSGRVDAVADYAWALPVWAGMDQALQNWARREAIGRGWAIFDDYSLPFMEPYVITRENALASGPAPIYGPDYESYFRAKWKKEFGVG